MFWFYLLSGLFLGWSLGANDAANIFGTAVGTRMVKFRVAAIVTSIFVILGAVFSGAGATATLGDLGAVNALAGSFTVALAAAVTVAGMTRMKLPISTSQAIVGAIIGWNLFTGSPTDYNSLTKIVSTWIASPILTAIFAFVLFKLVMRIVSRLKVHILEQDAYNRLGLLLVGAFGAYSLGANNIANVMGVFVSAAPLKDIHLFDSIHFSGTRQLFLLGALAIGAGVFTYSQKVMLTVGNDLFRLTPVAALVVVFSESLVLFLFASRVLEQWLLSHGLPAFPLVPVSSSQAVIGGIIGIGLAKRGHGIHYGILGKIALGWVATPIIAGVFSFVALFFVQNVFEQTVVAPKSPELSNISVEEKVSKENLRSSIVRSPGSHLLFEAKVLQTKARSTQLREMAMIEDIKQIVSGLDNKFQKGNDPFQIMTRLMEEVGELAAEVNHFEGLGVKMQKHGSPDKRKLAKELQDVIRCVVEIMLYYQVEGELNASIAASKNSLIRDGFL